MRNTRTRTGTILTNVQWPTTQGTVIRKKGDCQVGKLREVTLVLRAAVVERRGAHYLGKERMVMHIGL